MRVPLLDLERQNMPLEAELLDAFRRVVRSGHFILGLEVERFFFPTKLPGEVISLPVFPEMTEEEQGAVVGAVAEFANG